MACAAVTCKCHNVLHVPAVLCRTPEEYAEGHAIGAVNIPFLVKSSEGMQGLQFLDGNS
jgi:hypothetical protein